MAVLATLALVVVLVVGLNQASGGDSGATSRPPFDLAKARRDLAGAPAPLAALHDQSAQLLDGGRPAFRRRLAKLKGYPVVVNKWASWCAPCRTELPAVAAYAARPGAVAVLGVDVRDDPRAALALLDELDVRLPMVTDPDDILRGALGIPPGLPMSYLVRADGSVARVDPPIPFGSADDVAAAVERLS